MLYQNEKIHDLLIGMSWSATCPVGSFVTGIKLTRPVNGNSITLSSITCTSVTGGTTTVSTGLPSQDQVETLTFPSGASSIYYDFNQTYITGLGIGTGYNNYATKNLKSSTAGSLSWVSGVAQSGTLITGLSGNTKSVGMGSIAVSQNAITPAMQDIGYLPALQMACCAGADTSSDCAFIKSTLGCSSLMKTNCQGDAFQSCSSCAAYYKNMTSTSDYQDLMLGQNGFAGYCNVATNFDTDICRTFCTASTGTGDQSSSSNVKSICNNLYASKCSDPTNYGVASCGCNLPFTAQYYGNTATTVLKAGGTQNPHCYFSNCVSQGYFPKPLADMGCPSCTQYTELNISGDDNSLSGIVQSCISGQSSSQSSQSSITSQSSSTISSAWSWLNTTTELGLGAGLCVSCICIFLVLAIVLFMV